MAQKPPVHVEPRENGWAVVREGHERASSRARSERRPSTFTTGIYLRWMAITAMVVTRCLPPPSDVPSQSMTEVEEAPNYLSLAKYTCSRKTGRVIYRMLWIRAHEQSTRAPVTSKP